MVPEAAEPETGPPPGRPHACEPDSARCVRTPGVPNLVEGIDSARRKYGAACPTPTARAPGHSTMVMSRVWATLSGSQSMKMVPDPWAFRVRLTYWDPMLTNPADPVTLSRALAK
jgi:hypothetical protein